MALTKAKLETTIKVLTEVVNKKKEEVKALRKDKKEGVETVKVDVANLNSAISLLKKEVKAFKLKKPCKCKK